MTIPTIAYSPPRVGNVGILMGSWEMEDGQLVIERVGVHNGQVNNSLIANWPPVLSMHAQTIVDATPPAYSCSEEIVKYMMEVNPAIFN